MTEQFIEEKYTKEVLRALAMGWEVEKKVLNSQTGGLKNVLGFYIVKEGHKAIGRLGSEFSRSGIIFRRPQVRFV